MISVRIGSHRFHYRAAAVVIDDGHVLLHQLDGDSFWALPGGRVNPGEQARDAIVREFLEELNQSVDCGPLLCVGENFFDYEAEPHHELGLYFSVALPSASALLAKEGTHRGHEAGRALLFRWFPLPALLSIDMRPTALQSALASGSLPNHFVQQQHAA